MTVGAILKSLFFVLNINEILSFQLTIQFFLYSYAISYAADKFCYKCIVQWIKVAAIKYLEPPDFVTCPLCKVCLFESEGNVAVCKMVVIFPLWRLRYI